MCTPKTKIEREVDRLHRQLPALGIRQKNWALKHCTKAEWATQRRYGRKCDIEHFIIATTKEDWQVLRHFYLYAFYNRKQELTGTEFLPVMEQWYRNGDYVFYSRTRNGFSYCNDAWSRSSDMAIRRGRMETAYLLDPRELGYCEVRYERVTPQFQYIHDLRNCNIGKVYRAVNTDPIWETILKQNPEEYIWCARNWITEDKRKSAAVKVARRHRYDYRRPEWSDLLDNLIYLGKDYRNPHFVCPTDLHAMHDDMMHQATAKRERLSEKRMAEAQIRAERARLERMKREEERRQNAITEYPKARNRFFGVIIQGQGIEIKCLQSVEEFMEEGMEMHHCVFGNAYYDTKRHPNSLILSAKKDGQRVETIEVDISDYHIVQSRGKLNQNTPYHDTIVQLMQDNMDAIRKADKRRRKAV